MRMVNFGSGNICPDGWISLDWSLSALLAKFPYFYQIKKILFKLNFISKNILDAKWPKNITIWDMRWGVPFAKESVDITYASHFLEHLPKDKALRFLKRCHDILKTGGIIRLVVPDIDIIFNKYNKYISIDPIIATNELNLRLFEEGQHKHMYNYSTLSKTLSDIGFKKIKKLNFRKSAIADIKKLETPKLKYYTSLYIEAIK